MLLQFSSLLTSRSIYSPAFHYPSETLSALCTTLSLCNACCVVPCWSPRILWPSVFSHSPGSLNDSAHYWASFTGEHCSIWSDVYSNSWTSSVQLHCHLDCGGFDMLTPSTTACTHLLERFKAAQTSPADLFLHLLLLLLLLLLLAWPRLTTGTICSQPSKWQYRLTCSVTQCGGLCPCHALQIQ